MLEIFKTEQNVLFELNCGTKKCTFEEQVRKQNKTSQNENNQNEQLIKRKFLRLRFLV